MTSTLRGMDRDRRSAVRALLVQQAASTMPSTQESAATVTPACAGHGSPAARPLWKRPQLAYGSAVGITVAVIATVGVTALVSRPLPAYAVSGGNGEGVIVKVNRLRGERALQAALRERGVTADITYLPSNRQCQPGRYAQERTPGLSLSVSADRFEVRIPAGAVDAEQTFVLSASVKPREDGVQAIVDFGMTRGAVAPCTSISAS